MDICTLLAMCTCRKHTDLFQDTLVVMRDVHVIKLRQEPDLFEGFLPRLVVHPSKVDLLHDHFLIVFDAHGQDSRSVRPLSDSPDALVVFAQNTVAQAYAGVSGYRWKHFEAL